MNTTFDSLSKAQKRYVAILAKYRPNRDPSGEITSSFVRTLHHELLAKRDFGGEKIGWPRWVFVENKTGESEGFVPFATEDQLKSFNTDVEEQTVRKTLQIEPDQVQLIPERSLSDADFEAECRAAGIDF